MAFIVAPPGFALKETPPVAWRCVDPTKGDVGAAVWPQARRRCVCQLLAGGAGEAASRPNQATALLVGPTRAGGMCSCRSGVPLRQPASAIETLPDRDRAAARQGREGPGPGGEGFGHLRWERRSRDGCAAPRSERQCRAVSSI